METDSEKALQTLCNSAWAAHANGDETEAEKLFRQCLAVEPDSIEIIYGLALVMKAKGQNGEAIRLFEEVIRKIESRKWENHARARMLRRLALGQVNYLREQDWNLEREVWQR